jgi:hypothetical protein
VVAVLGFAALSILLGSVPTDADANQRKKREGSPFLTVFPLSGLGTQWWIAEYDNTAAWLHTAWRASGVSVDTSGIRLDLTPTPQDMRVTKEELADDDGTLAEKGATTKRFTSGQVQRKRWYGYGRYEVVMQPAVGDGLISAFYVYTGPFFGHTHEEIDIELLGRDTTKIYMNRFIDGKPMEEPVLKDLGFDAGEKPRLYAFEWREDSLTWFAEDQELFRLDGADDVPKPPAKIYLDLWAGGPGQVNWAGEAADDTTASAIVQCVSFSPLDAPTPQCSDIVAGN